MLATAQTPQTMILRFRDLSTDTGQTIATHSAIIHDKGSVWWGWWKKQGEKIPWALFQTFARAAPFEIYLFDTGTLSLYKTVLLDIIWDSKGSFIADSPDANLTPDYYGKSTYLTWFRFKQIKPVSNGAAFLRDWSYVRVDEFFETNKSIFLDFYDKQISSYLELKHQERTIWFIRPRVPQDRTHEIHVYDSARVVPENFPKNAISSSSNALLWISDPHFSDDHHRFALVSGYTGWDLSEAIRNDIEQFLGAREVAGVLLTGDLTWKAEPKEFELARSFIERVRSWATLQHNSNSVVVCPGKSRLCVYGHTVGKGRAPHRRPGGGRQELFFFLPEAILYKTKQLVFVRATLFNCQFEGRRHHKLE